MSESSFYLYWLIVGCEAAFWVVLVSALGVRYLLKRERISRLLLYVLPAVDLLLLVFTALDLRRGVPATLAHGLATAYVGFTIAFGGVIIAWADRRFARWFANGPVPETPAAHGWGEVREELWLWLRSIVAWIITLALLSALIAFLDNPVVTEPLHVWFRIALGSVFFWFLFGPVWSLVFFRRSLES